MEEGKYSRQLIMGLFYGTVLLVLALQVRIGRKPDYRVFTMALGYSTVQQLDHNEKLLFDFKKQMKEYEYNYNDKYFIQSFGKADALHQGTLKALNKIEEWTEDFIAGDHRKSKVLFVKHTDSLRRELENLLDLMVRHAHARDPAFETQLPFYRIRSENTWQEIVNSTSIHAGVALIYALRYDMVVSEAIAVRQVIMRESLGGCGFDNIEAVAIPRQGFVMPGEKVHARIAYAVFMDNFNPRFETNQGAIKKVEHGMGTWEGSNNKYGIHTASGTATIAIKDSVITKPWSFQYMVGPAVADLHLDNMSFCYEGVPNPVTIRSAAYPLSSLSLRVPGAIVQKLSDSNYSITIRPGRSKTLVAWIDHRNEKGTTTAVGSMSIKIKELPTPMPVAFYERSPGLLRLERLRHGVSIRALHADDDFPMSYETIGYELSIIKKDRRFLGPFTVIGSDYIRNADVKAAVAELQAGDKMVFSEIKVKEATGRMIMLVPWIVPVE